MAFVTHRFPVSRWLETWRAAGPEALLSSSYPERAAQGMPCIWVPCLCVCVALAFGYAAYLYGPGIWVLCVRAHGHHIHSPHALL